MATEQIAELNIHQRIAKIRKQVEVIQKDSSGYNYKYVSDVEILARISGLMEKYHLNLIPEILPGTLEVIPYLTKKTRTTRDGTPYEENVNEVLVHADMVFEWVNVDNPEERVEVPWVVIGHQDDASQSLGSGLTYCTRYFLLKFFNIATPDNDPDKWRAKQKASSEAEEKMITQEIIETFDHKVKAYLTANPKDADAVKAMIGKYVKGSDYFKIADSSLASKMAQEFEDTFVSAKKE